MEHANPEDAVLAQARKDFDSWADGDTEGYGESAADDVTYFHNVPAHPRVDGIRAFREYLVALRGQIPPHRYEIVNPKVQVYGSVGILTLHYRALSSEGELLARARGTCVYRETNGAWKMVHTHWSGLEDG